MIVADHPSVEDLQAFSLGTLDDEALTSVEMHLADCPECQSRAAESADDNLVEVLRRIHSQTARDTDAAEQTQTLGPTPADDTAGSPFVDSIPQDLVGHERYRIVRLLGEGGMGSVFEAEHRLMRRTVAVKVIKSAFTARASAVDRFRREVRAAARLAHPNIVTIYDAEDAGSTLFLAMEYVEGVSLAQLVKKQGPLPLEEASDYIRQASLGLQHAHERGMVHRDVKPDNLIRTPDGQVKVLDFGLAALTEEASGDLTEANMVMGTPDFMAPEQAETPHQADRRADVYSLGCTLYYLLTGKPPYPASTSVQRIIAHRESPLPAIGQARPDLPPELSAIVARMLAKQPEDRYSSAGEVAEALRPYAGDDDAPRLLDSNARVQFWLIAATVLFLLLLAAVAIYRVETDRGELVITTESDDVEVVIKQGGKVVRIIDTKTNKSISLYSGVYELELKDGGLGLKLNINSATLTRGDTVLAKVERVAKPSTDTVKRVDLPAAAKSAIESPASGKVREVFRKRWDKCPVTSGVDLSPDGRLLLSTHWGGVRVWDIATGESLHEWRGWSSQFTLDGKQIVTLTPDDERGGSLRLYDTAGGKLVREFAPHSVGLNGAYICPDGRTVGSGGKDGVVRLWDLTTGERIEKDDPWAVIWGDKEVPALAKRLDLIPDYVLPGGREVMFRGLLDGRFVRIYEISSGRLVRKIPLAETGQVEVVGISAGYGHKRMAFGLVDGTILVVDLVTGKEVARFSAGSFEPRILAISTDDRLVAACPWNAKGDVIIWRLPEPAPTPNKAEVEAVKRTREVRRFEGVAGKHVMGVAISQDGSQVLTVGTIAGPGWRQDSSNTIRLYELNTGKQLVTLDGSAKTFSVAISADGKSAISGGDQIVRIWSLASGKMLSEWTTGDREPAWEGNVFSVAFSPDGKHAFSASFNGDVMKWEVASGKSVQLFQQAIIPSMAVSANGERLAIIAEPARWAANDGITRVRVLDTATGKELCAIPTSPTEFGGVCITPDGGRVAWGHSDGTIRVWDVKLDREVQKLPFIKGLMHAIAYSPDGKRLLATTSAGFMRLWDAGSGKPIDDHSDPSGVRAVAFSPDGQFVVTGNMDGHARLFRLPGLPTSREKP